MESFKKASRKLDAVRHVWSRAGMVIIKALTPSSFALLLMDTFTISVLTDGCSYLVSADGRHILVQK